MNCSFERLRFWLIFFATIYCTTHIGTASGFSQPRLEILEKALAEVEKVTKNITTSIKNFHYYDYDGHPYDIHDGGYGMYDGIGNKIYHTDEDVTEVLYDFNLAYGNYVYGVRSSHPLFGVAWIRNPDKEHHMYRIQIEGYPGLPDSRSIRTSEGEVTLDAARLQYKAFQVFGEGTPSICELYYILENDRWGSVKSDNFSVMTFSKTTDFLQNAVYMTGRPQNLLMGYTLLSNSDGQVISTTEIEESLKISANAVLEINVDLRNFTESVLQAIESESLSIQAAVTNWYNYSYTMQEIQNGGEDMYGRRGNRIHFNDDTHSPTQLFYERWYTGNTYQVTSKADHPFFALMWINNPTQETHSYLWEVSGYAGVNRAGIILRYDGVLEKSNMTVQYKIFTLSNIRSHPSICEVYFVLDSKIVELFCFIASNTPVSIVQNTGLNRSNKTNKQVRQSTMNSIAKRSNYLVFDQLPAYASGCISIKVPPIDGSPPVTLGGLCVFHGDRNDHRPFGSFHVWNSRSNYSFSASFGNDSENLMNTVSIEGAPHNLLFGNLLLSKKNASRVREIEVRNVLSIIIEELSKIEEVSENHLNKIQTAIESISLDLTNTISNWHEYLYDEQFYKISYELQEMYNPWGNQMIIAEDLDHATYKRTSYDKYYKYENAAVKCLIGHPFVALMLVDNDKFDAFSLKLHSHVDLIGSEKYVEYEGSLTVSGTAVKYFVFQIYGKTQPSLCEVYFTLSNPTNWSSVTKDTYIGKHFEKDNIMDNYIYVLGYVKRVFMGYTLLSKYPGNESITEGDVRKTLTFIAEAVTKSLSNPEEFTYCEEESVYYPHQSDFLVTFPETSGNSIAYTEELCQEGTTYEGEPYGSRLCTVEGKWEEANWLSACTVNETTTSKGMIEGTTSKASSLLQANTRLYSFIIITVLTWTYF